MSIKKACTITSKAGKAKNSKWASVERFKTGHDSVSMSLLPEIAQLKFVERHTRNPISVWRSSDFGKSREDRVYESAKRLLDAGRAESIDDAVAKATQALTTSWGTKIETELVSSSDK